MVIIAHNGAYTRMGSLMLSKTPFPLYLNMLEKSKSKYQELPEMSKDFFSLRLIDEACKTCRDLLHYLLPHIYFNPDNLLLRSANFPLPSWVKLDHVKRCPLSANPAVWLRFPCKVSLRYSLKHVGEN